jgi:hypothetical protein
MCAGALPIRSVVVSRGWPVMGIESSDAVGGIRLGKPIEAVGNLLEWLEWGSPE